jgi:tRNA modification GTPase
MSATPTSDLICACATPPGTGAISIVRLTGPGALGLVDRCFSSHSGTQNILHAKSHSLVFGHLIEPHTRESLDDVLVGVMRGPHSYTGEDTVEINCHGSPHIVRRVLRTLCNHGARLAEAGEFTRRAFENGQIDLAQAEAICDLVSAQTGRAAEISLRQLNGQLSERISKVRERILDLLADVEAHIDFPEEDIPVQDQDRMLLTLHSIGAEIQSLIAGGERGQLLRHGARVVLVGKPNAGKSSLFNRLLGQDRAIVTPEPGTTRDTLESLIDVEGLPLTVIDTAGIRQAASEIEHLGIVRTEREIADASVVLMCVPVDEPWTSVPQWPGGRTRRGASPRARARRGRPARGRAAARFHPRHRASGASDRQAAAGHRPRGR